jgi:hypothetical protein
MLGSAVEFPLSKIPDSRYLVPESNIAQGFGIHEVHWLALDQPGAYRASLPLIANPVLLPAILLEITCFIMFRYCSCMVETWRARPRKTPTPILPRSDLAISLPPVARHPSDYRTARAFSGCVEYRPVPMAGRLDLRVHVGCKGVGLSRSICG